MKSFLLSILAAFPLLIFAHDVPLGIFNLNFEKDYIQLEIKLEIEDIEKAVQSAYKQKSNDRLVEQYILAHTQWLITLEFLDKKQIGLEAFPNPFTQQTKIEFTLKAGWAKISLFDVLGHEIKVLSNQRFNEGTHSLTLVGHNLPTGSYYCHVQTAYGQEVKRLIKVR